MYNMLYTAITPISSAYYHTGTVDGTGPETIDGNTDTFFGSHGGNSSVDIYAQAIHTFANPVTLQKLVFRMSAYAYEYGDDTGVVAYSCYAQWWNGSVWKTIPGTAFSDYASQYHNSISRTFDSGVITLEGLNLVNCSKIMLFGSSRAFNYKNSNANCNHKLYEINAYREGYPEIFRAYNGSEVITIGGRDPLPTDKLRMSRNGVVYAIPLVDITDPLASPIRIYTSTGVKALILSD